MEKVSREKFIRLAAALGVGAASASVAACGGGSGGGGGSGSGSGGDSGNGSGVGQSTPAASADASGEAAGTGGSAIARESEVAPGASVKFKDGGKDAVLVHLDGGDFVAYSAVCTHAGCTVAYQNSQLACPCHGSIFDPANGGEVVSGPAQTPLPEIPVEVQDGQVVRA